MNIRYFILITNLLLLAGCSRQPIRIRCTSYADKEILPNGFEKNKSFSVAGSLAINGEIQNNELQVKELQKKTEIVLEEMGYSIKPIDKSNYCIIFNYGINDKSAVINTPRYIPGQTIKTTGSVSGTYGYYGQYNQHTSTSGTYVYTPELYTFYTKYISFFVYDSKLFQQTIKNNKFPSQIWQSTACCVDESSDLRSYLDFLAVSLFNIFGENKDMTLDAYGDNEAVAWLRDSYSNPTNIKHLTTRTSS